MALFAYDGNTTVLFVPSSVGIADLTAPTEQELADPANIDMSCFLSKDGWKPSANTNSVDAGKLCQRFDANVPGTWGGEITATFLRDSDPADDTAWNTFTYGLEGTVVVRYGQPHDQPFADGDVVETWPVICNQKQMNETVTNTNARFTQVFNVPSQPAIDAVVGGGS